ncbi:MAG: 30S ribosomal protein S16 [Bacteroidales bacterium]|nr:30S ribosomal protein S16 [Bacteroidales bacterium]
MPVKIRLSRHGRKRKPLYHIVVADSRAPRDGRFIDNLGSYNPNTNPATIELDFDKAFDWVQKGAQPTDTCRAILSYKGVLMKKHLVEGAKKGAFSEEDAEKKFQDWMKQKELKIQSKIDSLTRKKTETQKEKLAREAEVNEARAAEIAKKQSKLAAAAAAENATASEEEVVNEAPQPEVVSEVTPVVEETVETAEPATEEPKAEVAEVENVAEEIQATEESTEETTEIESTEEDKEEK